jgi:hypothetical protein
MCRLVVYLKGPAKEPFRFWKVMSWLSIHFRKNVWVDTSKMGVKSGPVSIPGKWKDYALGMPYEPFCTTLCHTPASAISGSPDRFWPRYEKSDLTGGGGSRSKKWPVWYGKSRTSRLELKNYIHWKIFFASRTWLGCILLLTVCGALPTNCGLQGTEYRGDQKISILVGVSRLKFLRAISTLKSAQT